MTKLSHAFRSPKLPSVSDGVAIVTGASSGIGLATAAALVHHQGTNFHVIGSTRDPAKVIDPIPGVEYLQLDLEQPDSIARFCEQVLERGTPSVLVNNAGESQSGPLEELPREALERLMQVNVIGHVDVTQRLLPAMRNAGRGRIVMVGSMLGSFPLAYRSSYVASKAAIKGFAFASRRELRPFGIGMMAMEPGSINTGLSSRRTKYVDEKGVYGREFFTMLRKLDRNESMGITPERVADVILEAILDERPKPLYATGSAASVAFPFSRIVPEETMHWIINKKHGL
ncbi:SDR family oxidoreductase [Corynebacterium anserum]|uniref:SDR family NAD(P)-dependent oxidoreductase n=1 Tax=Corynebacterium anserum TaxID=2684406 RepID=A0A7G7YLU4_9CORY|nr:SDR family oxidoreductase [Corynebacterium anserum]MBC2681370.1 SDR family NAD(P)-dependent oxidoreductase [Corynebacterium anserum]QNH95464.1 SDR family NAD(P)-dependent oxidoreductase [Corynebacterium anserum]